MIIDVENGVSRSIRRRATYAIDSLMCAAGVSWREAGVADPHAARGGAGHVAGRLIVLLRYGVKTRSDLSGARVVVDIPSDPELYAVEGHPLISGPWRDAAGAAEIGPGQGAELTAERRHEQSIRLGHRSATGRPSGPGSPTPVIVERQGETVVCRIGADIVGWIFHCLTATGPEDGRAPIDSHADRPPWPCRQAVHPGTSPAGAVSEGQPSSTRPIVDDLVHLFVHSLVDACGLAQVPLLRKALWPTGEDWAIFLSHDVDRIRKWTTGRILREIAHGLRPAISAARSIASGDDAYWSGFEGIVASERSHDFRSTFYVGGRYARAGLGRRRDITYRIRREKDLLSFLSAALEDGWEVGLHGSLFSSQSSDLLSRERAELEDALGIAVSGVRQHYLRLDRPHTWRRQEQAGFLYDATLGNPRSEGFAAGTALPFQPYDIYSERALSLTELPLVAMDATLDGYRRYSFEQAEGSVRALVQTVRGRGGIFSFLLHQNSLDVHEHPYMGELYNRLLELAAQAKPFCATGEEIRRWWRIRAGMHLKAASHSPRTCNFILESPVGVENIAYIFCPSRHDYSLAVSGCDASWRRREDGSWEVNLQNVGAGRPVEIVLGL